MEHIQWKYNGATTTQNSPLEEIKTLLYYQGAFKKSVISRLYKKVKAITRNFDDYSTSIFKVFIEMSQNVCHHSTEKDGTFQDVGVGSFFIRETKTQLLFYTVNRIANDSLQNLKLHISKINSLKPEELRTARRKQYLTRDHSKKGANLGIIQIALSSKNEIKIDAKFYGENQSKVLILATIDK